MAGSESQFGAEYFPAGSVIIRQGDIPDKFYLITKGRVEVVRREAGGEETVINVMETGDFFGEIGLLQQSLRVATIRAVTDVQLMAMDRQTFRRWLDSSHVIWDEVNAVMARRLSNISELEPAGEMPEAEAAGPVESGTMAAAGQAEEPMETATAAAAAGATAAGSTTEPGSRHFEAGQIIVRQGDRADHFFIIVRGQVAVTHQDDSGRESEIAHLSDGDYFGEVGLMEGGTRTASVRAKTAVDVMVLDRASFSKWLSEAPFISQELKQTAQQRAAGSQSPPMHDQSAE
jgi:cAMP-dependent protein kinase regulator